LYSASGYDGAGNSTAQTVLTILEDQIRQVLHA
jgi:hypothetical protein